MDLTTSQPVKQKRRFLVWGGMFLLILFEKLIELGSKVSTKPVLPNQEFPWIRTLEDNWLVIRREVDSLMLHRHRIPNLQDISRDQGVLTQDDKWKSFFLIGFGNVIENNCRQCPETYNLVRAIPGVTTALFSILGPYKHIPDHRGPLKGLIRFHLGIIVPESIENCTIRVHDQYLHWEEKRGIIFDDTFHHEIWNNTDHERVVLLIDVIRPVKFPISLFNRLCIGIVKRTRFVKDAIKNQAAWDQKLALSELNTGMHE